jgi:hypothetical protein
MALRELTPNRRDLDGSRTGCGVRCGGRGRLAECKEETNFEEITLIGGVEPTIEYALKDNRYVPAAGFVVYEWFQQAV